MLTKFYICSNQKIQSVYDALKKSFALSKKIIKRYVDHLMAPIWGFGCAIDWFHRALHHVGSNPVSLDT